ncbi:homoserine dehydrogenase [Pelomyxa schiedti]|nr:homoserine dehydrogenase [Pelomyxa schiedti]
MSSHKHVRVAVVVIGAGLVGTAVVKKLVDVETLAGWRNAVGATVEIVGWVDSSSVVGLSGGISPRAEFVAALECKARTNRLNTEGGPTHQLEEIVRNFSAHIDRFLPEALKVLVDVTASPLTQAALVLGLDLGFRVVLANKKPLAGPWAQCARLISNPRVRHESTVGGGIPVIAMLRYIMDTSDEILAIEGQLSGTLAYVLSEVEKGVPFSKAVRTAKESGYTEPHPRDDLAGADVGRKVLILARMAGWHMEPTDVKLESLYPPALADPKVGPEEFLSGLEAMDEDIARRSALAVSHGATLKYMARIEKIRSGENIGKCTITVGLVEVPKGSAPASGAAYLLFRTAVHPDIPLILSGHGAGGPCTAAGVLGDIISLAREQGAEP